MVAQFLSGLFSRTPNAAKRSSKRPNLRTRLHMEPLEERATPAGLYHVWRTTDTVVGSPLGELRKAVEQAAADFAANGGLETIDFKDPNNGNAILNGNIRLAQKLDDIN